MRWAEKAEIARGLLWTASTLVCCLTGAVGGVWVLASLFIDYGLLVGMLGLLLIPIVVPLFPIYFLVTDGIWWPLLFYGAVALEAFSRPGGVDDAPC